MHRATPLNTSFRSFSGGGARSVVDKVDDSKFMQEMSGNFMVNETRSGIESPQNYGFTSVVFDAEKDSQGKIQGAAETFVGFMGGSRSFPVSGPMDDRRHRLYKLEKGDTAMFRGRGDKQQLHMTADGGFWTAPQDKTVRMQLVPSDSETNATTQQQSGGGAGGSTGGSSSSSSSSSSGGQKKRGQEAIYKDGQKSFRFVDVTKDKTRVSGSQCHLMLDDGKTYVHANSDKNVYLGGAAGSGAFSMLVTLDGPCSNSLGKL